MKNVKVLMLAIILGGALALGSCSEEVVLPDGGNTGSTTQTDPDG